MSWRARAWRWADAAVHVAFVLAIGAVLAFAAAHKFVMDLKEETP